MKKNLIDKNYMFFAVDVMKKFNFVKIPSFKIEKMVKIMQMDKKATSKNIIFILPTDYSLVDSFELNANELFELCNFGK